LKFCAGANSGVPDSTTPETRGGFVMKYRILAVLAATVLTSVAMANDDDKPKNSGAAFRALDADRDDRLSLNEVSGDEVLTQRFAALDRNSDGYLTPGEYSTHVKRDKNRNEDMTRQERKPY
jgi:hypothetical protein